MHILDEGPSSLGEWRCHFSGPQDAWASGLVLDADASELEHTTPSYKYIWVSAWCGCIRDVGTDPRMCKHLGYPEGHRCVWVVTEWQESQIPRIGWISRVWFTVKNTGDTLVKSERKPWYSRNLRDAQASDNSVGLEIIQIQKDMIMS
jgi:hypothetical protein